MKNKVFTALYTFYDLIRILKDCKYDAYKQYPSYKGKRICVLGNGKSLNNTQLPDNSVFMVVNRHVLDASYCNIMPSFYVMADPFFWKDSRGLDIIKLINERTSWDMYLCLPYTKGVNYKIESLLNNEHISLIYYNNNQFRGGYGLKKYLYEKKLAMPNINNVIVAAIFLAVQMDFKYIELYGVEHDWLKHLYVGDDNLVYLLNEHSYDKNAVKPKPQKEIQNKEEYPLHEILRDYAAMFQSYWEIENYVKKSLKETNIINRTKESFIDAFKRK